MYAVNQIFQAAALWHQMSCQHLLWDVCRSACFSQYRPAVWYISCTHWLQELAPSKNALPKKASFFQTHRSDQNKQRKSWVFGFKVPQWFYFQFRILLVLLAVSRTRVVNTIKGHSWPSGILWPLWSQSSSYTVGISSSSYCGNPFSSSYCENPFFIILWDPFFIILWESLHHTVGIHFLHYTVGIPSSLYCGNPVFIILWESLLMMLWESLLLHYTVGIPVVWTTFHNWWCAQRKRKNWVRPRDGTENQTKNRLKSYRLSPQAMCVSAWLSYPYEMSMCNMGELRHVLLLCPASPAFCHWWN